MERIGRWLTLAALAAVALSFLIPFVLTDFRPPIGSFRGEHNAVLCGLFAMALLVASGPINLQLPRIAYLFIGFIVLILAQWTLGMLPYSQIAILGMLFLLYAVAMTVTARALVERLGMETVVRGCAVALLAASAFNAVAGYMQALGIASSFVLPVVGSRMYGDTGQPTHYATLLALGVMSACVLKRQWLCVAFVLLLVPAMFLSGSRSVVLYLLAIAGGIVWARPDLWKVVVQAGLVMLLICVAAVASTPGLLEVVTRSSVGESPRLHMWKEAAVMFYHQPLLGVGYREFAYNYFMADHPFGDQSIADNAHNLIFNVAAEFGIAGLAVLFIGLLAWVAKIIDDPVSQTRWWAYMVLAILGIHCLLEYPWTYSYFLGMMAFAFGLTESPDRWEEK